MIGRIAPADVHFMKPGADEGAAGRILFLERDLNRLIRQLLAEGLAEIAAAQNKKLPDSGCPQF